MFLKMEDSVCHHDKFGYCKFNDQIKFCKNKQPKSCRRFQIDRSFRLESICANLHPDHSREGNKTTTNDIKVELENPEKATKKESNSSKLLYNIYQKIC